MIRANSPPRNATIPDHSNTPQSSTLVQQAAAIATPARHGRAPQDVHTPPSLSIGSSQVPQSDPRHERRASGNPGPESHAYAAGMPPQFPLLPDSSKVKAKEFHADCYMKLPSGYRTDVEGKTVEPTLYQPTPKGLQILVDDFVERTSHDLRVHVQEGKARDSIRHRFEELRAAFKDFEPDPSKPTGIILSYGQMHAIPVLMAKHEGQNHLIVFDSTSGGVTKQYYHAANAFPDFHVLLNKGTRQADTQSCITDAFEILARSFAVRDLLPQILAKTEQPETKTSTGESSNMLARRRPAFIGVSLQQPNFSLFRMPEDLCFTAQRPQFIKEASQANPKKTLQIGNRTTNLGMEMVLNQRVSYRQPPTLSSGENLEEKKFFGMNSYLYKASREHKKIIDQRLAKLGGDATPATPPKLQRKSSMSAPSWPFPDGGDQGQD